MPSSGARRSRRREARRENRSAHGADMLSAGEATVIAWDRASPDRIGTTRAFALERGAPVARIEAATPASGYADRQPRGDPRRGAPRGPGSRPRRVGVRPRSVPRHKRLPSLRALLAARRRLCRRLVLRLPVGRPLRASRRTGGRRGALHPDAGGELHLRRAAPPESAQPRPAPDDPAGRGGPRLRARAARPARRVRAYDAPAPRLRRTWPRHRARLEHLRLSLVGRMPRARALPPARRPMCLRRSLVSTLPPRRAGPMSAADALAHLEADREPTAAPPDHGGDATVGGSLAPEDSVRWVLRRPRGRSCCVA